jgi:hypothetical protein
MENETDISARLDRLQERVEFTAKAVEKIRKYFLWTFILAIVTVVLPMIGLVFAIPFYLKTLNMGGL